MTDRYTLSIKIDQAKKFIEVESLRQQGREDLAWAKFCEYGVDMANLGGAMNAQLPASLPIDILPRGTRDFVAYDDRIVAVPFVGPARVSVSVADGIQVYLGASATAGELQTYGNGAALLEVGPGEFYASVKLADGMGAASANLWFGQV